MWGFHVLQRIAVASQHVRMLFQDRFNCCLIQLAEHVKRPKPGALRRQFNQNLVKYLRCQPAPHAVNDQLLQRVPVVGACQTYLMLKRRESLKAKDMNGNLWFHHLSVNSNRFHSYELTELRKLMTKVQIPSRQLSEKKLSNVSVKL